MALLGWLMRLIINVFALAGGGLVVLTQTDVRGSVLWALAFGALITTANDQIGRDE